MVHGTWGVDFPPRYHKEGFGLIPGVLDGALAPRLSPANFSFFYLKSVYSFASWDKMARDRQSSSSDENEMDRLRKEYSYTSSAEIIRERSVDSVENDVERAGPKPVVANMEEIALKALHVDDDPTLNPWTFRVFFLGLHILIMTHLPTSNFIRRYWAHSLRVRTWHHILVQASECVSVHHLPYGHILRGRSRTRGHDSSEGVHWQVAESSFVS